MKVGGRARLLPQPHEPAVPWDYFLVETGRGGARVSDWIHGSVCSVAAEHAGVNVDLAHDAHLTALLTTLPSSPDLWLEVLLSAFRLSVHTLGPVTTPATLVGSPVSPIPAHTLVHDGAVQLRRNYGPDRLPLLLGQLDSAPSALTACEASLYLLLLLEGEPAETPDLAPEPGRMSHWITPGE